MKIFDHASKAFLPGGDEGTLAHRHCGFTFTQDTCPVCHTANLTALVRAFVDAAVEEVAELVQTEEIKLPEPQPPAQDAEQTQEVTELVAPAAPAAPALPAEIPPPPAEVPAAKKPTKKELEAAKKASEADGAAAAFPEA